MLECKEVKEYLDSIGLPYDEKESGGMKVLQMQYNQDLCAIFPPVEDCPRYSVVLAYNGAVQSGDTMDLDQLKDWIYKVWILNSEDYVYEDEPNGQVVN